VIHQLLEPMIDAMLQSARELASWADVLVLHHFAHPLAAAAESAGKPFVCLYMAPLFATRAFPPTGQLPNFSVINALGWKFALAALSRFLLGSMNEVRVRLGLPPIKRAWQQLDQSAIDIVAVSPTLLSRPDDWSLKVHLTGSLIPQREPKKAQLGAEVGAFLADGPAPVYITFGSMSRLEKNPSELMDQVEHAVAMAGCRAIVQSDVSSRQSGLVSSRVLRVGATEHHEVFPRCAAIVHHGGAGTTQAALRAGRPSVVVAHFSDQFLWGQRLHRLGVAPPFLLRQGLKAKSLARAIEQGTQNAAMANEAERLGRLMSQENGLQRAVELIGRQQPARQQPR
jgi:UDP:flavonoid glycosyltransferase YjiC (YdhE family)